MEKRALRERPHEEMPSAAGLHTEHPGPPQTSRGNAKPFLIRLQNRGPTTLTARISLSLSVSLQSFLSLSLSLSLFLSLSLLLDSQLSLSLVSPAIASLTVLFISGWVAVVGGSGGTRDETPRGESDGERGGGREAEREKKRDREELKCRTDGGCVTVGARI